MWRHRPRAFLRVAKQGRRFLLDLRGPAYCQLPTPFAADESRGCAGGHGPKTYLDYFNNDASARWEMILAMLGAILLWWSRLVGLGMAAFRLRLRRILLGTMVCWPF